MACCRDLADLVLQQHPAIDRQRAAVAGHASPVNSEQRRSKMYSWHAEVHRQFQGAVDALAGSVVPLHNAAAQQAATHHLYQVSEEGVGDFMVCRSRPRVK